MKFLTSFRTSDVSDIYEIVREKPKETSDCMQNLHVLVLGTALIKRVIQDYDFSPTLSTEDKGFFSYSKYGTYKL